MLDTPWCTPLAGLPLVTTLDESLLRNPLCVTPSKNPFRGSPLGDPSCCPLWDTHWGRSLGGHQVGDNLRKNPRYFPQRTRAGTPHGGHLSANPLGATDSAHPPRGTPRGTTPWNPRGGRSLWTTLGETPRGPPGRLPWASLLLRPSLGHPLREPTLKDLPCCPAFEGPPWDPLVGPALAEPPCVNQLDGKQFWKRWGARCGNSFCGTPLA